MIPSELKYVVEILEETIDGDATALQQTLSVLLQHDSSGETLHPTAPPLHPPEAQRIISDIVATYATVHLHGAPLTTHTLTLATAEAQTYLSDSQGYVRSAQALFLALLICPSRASLKESTLLLLLSASQADDSGEAKASEVLPAQLNNALSAVRAAAAVRVAFDGGSPAALGFRDRDQCLAVDSLLFGLAMNAVEALYGEPLSPITLPIVLENMYSKLHMLLPLMAKAGGGQANATSARLLRNELICIAGDDSLMPYVVPTVAEGALVGPLQPFVASRDVSPRLQVQQMDASGSTEGPSLDITSLFDQISKSRVPGSPITRLQAMASLPDVSNRKPNPNHGRSKSTEAGGGATSTRTLTVTSPNRHSPTPSTSHSPGFTPTTTSEISLHQRQRHRRSSAADGLSSAAATMPLAHLASGMANARTFGATTSWDVPSQPDTARYSMPEKQPPSPGPVSPASAPPERTGRSGPLTDGGLEGVTLHADGRAMNVSVREHESMFEPDRNSLSTTAKRLAKRVPFFKNKKDHSDVAPSVALTANPSTSTRTLARSPTSTGGFWAKQTSFGVGPWAAGGTGTATGGTKLPVVTSKAMAMAQVNRQLIAKGPGDPTLANRPLPSQNIPHNSLVNRMLRDVVSHQPVPPNYATTASRPGSPGNSASSQAFTADRVQSAGTVRSDRVYSGGIPRFDRATSGGASRPSAAERLGARLSDLTGIGDTSRGHSTAHSSSAASPGTRGRGATSGSRSLRMTHSLPPSVRHVSTSDGFSSLFPSAMQDAPDVGAASAMSKQSTPTSRRLERIASEGSLGAAPSPQDSSLKSSTSHTGESPHPLMNQTIPLNSLSFAINTHVPGAPQSPGGSHQPPPSPFSAMSPISSLSALTPMSSMNARTPRTGISSGAVSSRTSSGVLPRPPTTNAQSVASFSFMPRLPSAAAGIAPHSSATMTPDLSSTGAADDSSSTSNDLPGRTSTGGGFHHGQSVSFIDNSVHPALPPSSAGGGSSGSSAAGMSRHQKLPGSISLSNLSVPTSAPSLHPAHSSGNLPTPSIAPRPGSSPLASGQPSTPNIDPPPDRTDSSSSSDMSLFCTVPLAPPSAGSSLALSNDLSAPLSPITQFQGLAPVRTRGTLPPRHPTNFITSFDTTDIHPGGPPGFVSPSTMSRTPGRGSGAWDTYKIDSGVTSVYIDAVAAAGLDLDGVRGGEPSQSITGLLGEMQLQVDLAAAATDNELNVAETRRKANRSEADPVKALTSMAAILGGKIFLLQGIRLILSVCLLVSSGAVFYMLTEYGNLDIAQSLAIVVGMNLTVAGVLLLFVVLHAPNQGGLAELLGGRQGNASQQETLRAVLPTAAAKFEPAIKEAMTAMRQIQSGGEGREGNSARSGNHTGRTRGRGGVAALPTVNEGAVGRGLPEMDAQRREGGSVVRFQNESGPGVLGKVVDAVPGLLQRLPEKHRDSQAVKIIQGLLAEVKEFASGDGAQTSGASISGSGVNGNGRPTPPNVHRRST